MNILKKRELGKEEIEKINGYLEKAKGLPDITEEFVGLLKESLEITKGSESEVKLRDIINELIGVKIAEKVEGFENKKGLEEQIKGMLFNHDATLGNLVDEKKVYEEAVNYLKESWQGSAIASFQALFLGNPKLFDIVDSYINARKFMKKLNNGDDTEQLTIINMPADEMVYKLGADYGLICLSSHLENQHPIELASDRFHQFYESIVKRIEDYSHFLKEEEQQNIEHKIQSIQDTWKAKIAPVVEKICKKQDEFYNKAEEYAQQGKKEEFKTAFKAFSEFTMVYSRILDENEDKVNALHAEFIEQYFKQNIPSGDKELE